MRQFLFCIGLCGSAICATAANQLSWVASFGADNAACGTRVAPCRTFQGAIANTIVGGIVKAIDAADYTSLNGAPLAIQSPITIDGADVGAALTTRSIAIEVLAGPAGTPPGMVTIRNLTVNVSGDVSEGIQAFRPVHIENVTITGGTFGISAGRGAVLTADHITISGASSDGLLVAGGTALLRNSAIHGAALGVDLFDGTAMIDHSEISSNNTGIFADGLSTLRIGNSVITGNSLGIAKARSGRLFSFGNNMIAGNTVDGDAELIPLK